MRQASNIVFTNGGLDPWSAGGVLESLSPTVVSIFIPEGAHHLDLFFSRAEDPPCVRDARAQQVVHMHRWVAEARAAAK
ncbi:hypothetical protein T484DRAFT_1819987 [Baffinella frigidus]|nr:hypothetical protein T484DRAFT_1819987 [Cryptophyta sp. CCMP2293]